MTENWKPVADRKASIMDRWEGMHPLCLMDGTFGVAEFAHMREGGVVIQGTRVGDGSPFEIILSPPVLKMVDAVRSDEGPEIEAEVNGG